MATLNRAVIIRRCVASSIQKIQRIAIVGTSVVVLAGSTVKMADKVVPTVKAEEAEEEELVDPQTQLREICHQKPDCQAMWARFQECNDRVNSRSKTSETCEEEAIDYVHVLDKCVNKDLFKRLK